MAAAGAVVVAAAAAMTVAVAASAVTACRFVSSETVGTSPYALACIFVVVLRRTCATSDRPCSD